jgi:hypothetical protein
LLNRTAAWGGDAGQESDEHDVAQAPERRLMGHSRLGILPRTRDWKAVVQLLGEGAAVDEIAAASARAAESSLPDLVREEALVRSLWLLTQIPRAARSADFADALQRLDLNTSRNPSLIDIVTAVFESVDRHVARAGKRTDFGEISQRAAAESLATLAGRELPGLFGVDAEDVRRAVGKFATVRNFGVLARDFFARLTRRHLEYYLGRELANHIGPAERFGSLSQEKAFGSALTLHCIEAARIVEDFSAEWYSKAVFEDRLTPGATAQFAAVAFGKIQRELRQRRGADA